jgi:hypothetical protein
VEKKLIQNEEIDGWKAIGMYRADTTDDNKLSSSH